MLLVKKRQHSTTLITDWQTFHQIEEKKIVWFAYRSLSAPWYYFPFLFYFFPSAFHTRFLLLISFSCKQTKKHFTNYHSIKMFDLTFFRHRFIRYIFFLSLFWFSQTNQMWLTFGRARIIVLVSFFARFIYFCSQCGILFAFMHFKNENNSKSTMINWNICMYICAAAVHV